MIGFMWGLNDMKGGFTSKGFRSFHPNVESKRGGESERGKKSSLMMVEG